MVVQKSVAPALLVLLPLMLLFSAAWACHVPTGPNPIHNEFPPPDTPLPPLRPVPPPGHLPPAGTSTHVSTVTRTIPPTGRNPADNNYLLPPPPAPSQAWWFRDNVCALDIRWSCPTFVLFILHCKQAASAVCNYMFLFLPNCVTICNGACMCIRRAIRWTVCSWLILRCTFLLPTHARAALIL